MNIIQAIEVRKSRRTYCQEPLDSETAALFRSRIEEYNQKSGLTIRLIEKGSSAFSGIKKSYGLFRGVQSFFVMKGPQSDPHLKEKIGYYGELLVLEATAMGLGTCWVGGTFDSSGIRKGPQEELVCVITVGKVPDSETMRERFIYKAIHRKTKPVEALSEISGQEPAAWFYHGMKAVQKAPSTRNTQKVFFSYQDGVLRASVPDTYPFDMVDLGIAKLHFTLAAGGRFEIGNDAVYIPPERSDICK